MGYDITKGEETLGRVTWYVATLLLTVLYLQRYPGVLRALCPQILGISVPEDQPSG